MVFITRIVGSMLMLASIAAAMQDESSKYDDSAAKDNSSYDSNNKGSDSWDTGSSKYGDSSSDSSSNDGNNKGSDSWDTGSSKYGDSSSKDDSSNNDGNKGSDYSYSAAAPAESAMASDSAMSSETSSAATTKAAMTTEAAMTSEAATTTKADMTTEAAATTEAATTTEAAASDTASATTSAAMSETTTAAPASTTAYGSGSSGSQSMDDCVQQCMAKYSLSAGSSTAAAATDVSVTATATDASLTATATADASASGSGGGGATHTVVVSPSQGVLRYIPFAMNASVGDTVQFMWGANNHTVTKGSQLLPCNKSAEEPSFTSGLQQKDFMFTEVVNTTDPTFIFCNTPTPDGANHCAKGMFFILNPPSSSGASTSVGGAMQSAKAANPKLKAYATYTDNMTEGLSMASWGTNIDIGGMPDWSHSLVMENVLFTRNVFAANPDMEDADGSWSVGAMGSNPMVVPLDVSEAVAASGTGSVSATGVAYSTAVPSPSASAGAQSGALNDSNSAFTVSSSKAQVYVALSIIVVTFFAL